MMRKLFLLAAFSLLGYSLGAQTADDVVNKYIEARGGMAKIKGVKTQRVSGTVSFGPGADAEFLLEYERPLKLHNELTINGQKMVRTFDGKDKGWIYNPFMPNPSVQPMTADELTNTLAQADLDSPLVDYKSKGNQLEFVDKEEVMGRGAYKIKMTMKSGEVGYFYFDADTHLLMKWESTRKIGSTDVLWEELFSDFREVDGLKFAFLIETRQPGTAEVQRITAEKIEINVPIDEAHFGKPAAPASAAVPGEASGQPAKPN